MYQNFLSGFFKRNLSKLTIFSALLVFCSCLGCFSGAPDRYLDDKKHVDYLMNASVVVLVPTANTSCTGVFIAPELILTARHCFMPDPPIPLPLAAELVKDMTFPILDYDNFTTSPLAGLGPEELAKVSHVKVAYFPITDETSDSYTHDVVVLEMVKDEYYKPSKHWVDIAEELPKIDDRVYTVSNPRGFSWILREGRIAQYSYNRVDKKPPFDVYWLMVSINIDKGSSGGMLVNDYGKMVGILSAANMTRDLGIYVPSTVLNEVVSDYVKIKAAEKKNAKQKNK